MKLAIVMDSPESIKPYKDSTVAMILAAQTLGWSVHYTTINTLSSYQDQAFADMHAIKVIGEQAHNWADITPIGEMPLADYDILLMRKDPPFNMEYIYATYALDLVEKAGVLVANKPQALRDVNEKYAIMRFPQCAPLTLVSRDMNRLKQFWRDNQQVIFKPLDGMGGQSIYYVDDKGLNLPVILESLTQHGCCSVMAQQYIEDIYKTGDKRVLIIDGKPVSHALARMPGKEDIRGNLAAGAQGKVVPLTDRDYWIVDQVGNALREQGIYFAGIDIIGDYLTEINVTSPTCIREIESATGLTIAKNLLLALAEKCTN